MQQLDRAAVVARNSRPSFAEPIRSSRRGRRAESITGCPRVRSAGVPHDTCTNFKVPRDRRRRSASIRVANRELVAGSGRAGGRISSQSSGCFKCFVITRVILPCPNLSCNVFPLWGTLSRSGSLTHDRTGITGAEVASEGFCRPEDCADCFGHRRSACPSPTPRLSTASRARMACCARNARGAPARGVARRCGETGDGFVHPAERAPRALH